MLKSIPQVPKRSGPHQIVNQQPMRRSTETALLGPCLVVRVSQVKYPYVTYTNVHTVEWNKMNGKKMIPTDGQSLMMDRTMHGPRTSVPLEVAQ